MSALKGTHFSSNHLPGRSWLGARVRHIGREELFREIRLFRFHSGGGEGQSQQKEETNDCKCTKDFFTSCKKPQRARFMGEKIVYVVQSTEEQDGWEYRRGTRWHARDIGVNKEQEKGDRKSK